jgi:hypothetical protein
VFVHMTLARYLIEAGEPKAAVPSLRAVLEDDAGASIPPARASRAPSGLSSRPPASGSVPPPSPRTEARALLTSIYEQQGMHEELAGLLQAQFDRARDAQDSEAIVDIGLRIGGLLGDRHREQSIDAYRAALEWAPGDRDLLRALLARLGPDAEARERAEVLQSLLAAESGESAATLAVELADTWKALDEPDLVQRALELGLEKAPESERVRDLLEGSYAERAQWRELAQLFEREAARLGLAGCGLRAAQGARDRAG